MYVPPRVAAGFTFGRGYHDDAAVARDYKGLRALLKLLRKAFEPSGRLITLAYYPDGRQERLLAEYDAPQYVDFMHAMSYDQQGDHSSWEFAHGVAQQAASLLPAGLVTLGVPFYGRHTSTGEWKSYEDLVRMHALLPTDDRTADGYYFNGPALIERKTRLAADMGLGGVMIWEVGQDCRVAAVTHEDKTHPVTCPAGEESSLLTAIRRGLIFSTTSAKKQEL